jgi:hypothetical protein
MSDTAAELVRRLTILAVAGNGETQTVEGNLILGLSSVRKLHFTLEFDETMTDRQFWVTVVIHRRGRTTTLLNVPQNEFRHSRAATSFSRPIDVQGNPPLLEFDIEDDEPPEFHDGPGPYETAIALTPTDENGAPDEGRTSSLSYDFTGV